MNRPGSWRSQRRRALLVVIAILVLQAVLASPPALAQDCGEAPNPERPGSGMVGAIDATSSAGRGEEGSPYKSYGYAGSVWHIYETDCGPLSSLTDPGVTIDTWLGNQLFNVGKNIVGTTIALHYAALEGGLFAPIYDAVVKATDVVYNNVFAQLFGLFALLLAIVMFRHIWRGDLPSVSRRALFALAAVWLAASSFALLRYYEYIDNTIVQTTSAIQAGFVDDSEDRVVRDVLPTNLHNEIVYRNWLRGVFGAPDVSEAEEHGMALLDAQAFTWQQMVDGDDSDEAVIDAKKDEYERIYSELGPSQGYFTGEEGSRTGAGFIALLQSLIYALFQLVAKLAVLLAQVLVRLLTLTAPLIGLVALLHPDILRKVASAAGAVLFNLVVLSVLAGAHALLLNAIFASSMSMVTQMTIGALVTVLLWVVGRPVRRLWQMVEMSTRTVGAALPSAPSGLFSRFRRRQPSEQTQQDQFWRGVRDTDTDVQTEQRGAVGSADAAGKRVRPEGRIPVTATAQRLDPASGTGFAGAGIAAGTAAGTAAGVRGGPARAELPPGGRPQPAGLAFNPVRGGGAAREPMPVQARPRQRLDTTAAGGYSSLAGPRRTLGSGDVPEPVVVPSRMSSRADVPVGQPAPHRDASRGGAASAPRPQPRLADAEVVNGRPVFMVYRPSRGLEVRRSDVRDTDEMVR